MPTDPTQRLDRRGPSWPRPRRRVPRTSGPLTAGPRPATGHLPRHRRRRGRASCPSTLGLAAGCCRSSPTRSAHDEPFPTWRVPLRVRSPPSLGEDITVVARKAFGEGIGRVITVLYFLAIYPSCRLRVHYQHRTARRSTSWARRPAAPAARVSGRRHARDVHGSAHHADRHPSGLCTR
ncbi:hypothetical protein QJS66_13700 [Kocuria rhizophila]|nr:hypothetical protein QJS66_13700 [Kocuria rhizophila]